MADVKDGEVQTSQEKVEKVDSSVELSAAKKEVKRLSVELESAKKKLAKSELVGLRDFLFALYKESNDVKVREKLRGWMNRL